MDVRFGMFYPLAKTGLGKKKDYALLRELNYLLQRDPENPDQDVFIIENPDESSPIAGGVATKTHAGYYWHLYYEAKRYTGSAEYSNAIQKKQPDPGSTGLHPTS